MTPWIVTYGPGFDKAKQVAKSINESIKCSPSWKNENPLKVPLLKVVAKRAPNLKDTLFKRKAIALGSSQSPTVPCTLTGGKARRGLACQCCQLVSQVSVVKNNGNTVTTVGGNCLTHTLVYAATCSLCHDHGVYTGKTVCTLRDRVNSHRSSFYETTRKFKTNPDFFDSVVIDDVNILGIHLVKEHGKSELTDFNQSFKFDILAVVTPDRLRFTEQHFINKLDSLQPFGLNQINSIGSLSSRSRSFSF